MALRPLRLNEFFYSMNKNVVEKKKSDALTYIEQMLMLARASQESSSSIRLTVDNVEYVMHTNSLPWFQTADGGVVTDYFLQTRELFQLLCSPLFGKRFSRTPAEVAEWFYGCTMAMFAGNDSGGAVYAFGKWHLSPRWVPISPPAVLPIAGALHEDPYLTIMRTLQGDNLRGENAEKAMKLAVDPLYHMFRMAGTTTITIPSYNFIDASELFKDWKPTFVHNGGDAMDIVKRDGTFVGEDEEADWRSSAFDETFGTGRVLSVLQPPVLFDQRGIRSRIHTDDEGTWFLKSDKDYKLTGNMPAECLAALEDITALKLSWLSQRLNTKLIPGSKVNALVASPIGFIHTETSFARGLVPISARVTVTSEMLAYVRSDPRAPQELLRFVPVSGKSISMGWFSTSEETFLKQKGYA